MADKKIVEYIEKYQEEGFSHDEIIESLLSQDISKNAIDEAYDSLDTAKKPEKKHTAKKKETAEEDKKAKEEDDDEVFSTHHKGDPFSGQAKALFLGTFLVLVIVSYISLRLSNIGAGTLLTPVTEFMNSVRGTANIDITYVILSAVSFGTALTVLGYYAINRHYDDFLIYCAPVLLAVASFATFGFGMLSLFSVLGLTGSVAYFIVKIQDKKAHYKKVDFQEIIVGSYRGSFVLISFLLAFGVYVTLAGSPDFAELEIKNILETAGIDPDAGSDVQEQIIGKQKQTQYAMLESIEEALLAATAADPDLDKVCTDALEENMDRIDAAAKKQIDDAFENLDDNEETAGALTQINRISSLFDALKKKYHVFTALMIFLFAEFVRKMVGLVVFGECLLTKNVLERMRK